MEPITNTVSTFVESQLPEFIREGSPQFTAFLKAYYSWMEQGNVAPVIAQSKSLMSFKDIDETTDQFIQYYLNDFLPYFPNDIVLDKRKLIKIARDFYTRKGSLESVQFLFRVLYNQDIDIYLPKNHILRASDGKWNLPQALQLVLSSQNQSFNVALLEGHQGIGSISNAICTIESATKTIDPGLGIEIVEVYISNLNKPFNDLENLNITYAYDSNNNPLVFSEKIIASLSSINIDPNNRGLKYHGYMIDTSGNVLYEGDPVVIYGGLSPTDNLAQKAVAYVGNVTSGSITDVVPYFGGYAYRVQPNTVVDVINGPGDTTGSGANVIVQSIDTTNAIYVEVNTDSIEYKQNVALNTANFAFANFAYTNVNTALDAAFSYSNLEFAAITSMNVINGGGGYTAVPSVNLQVVYYSDLDTDLAIANDPSLANNLCYIDTAGYIAAVNIVNGGLNYNSTTDTIIVPTAIGYGAQFSFTTDANGSINAVSVVYSGEGYLALPLTLAIANSSNIANSANGSNAHLIAYGFGQGTQLNVAVNQIGQISDIRLVNRGFDYISTPNVSLKVADITINDPTGTLLFDNQEMIYQGANANSITYIANVDSYNATSQVLRVYNYQGLMNPAANLYTKTSNLTVTVNTSNSNYYVTYGNGKAKANAIFLNGLIKYPGFYSTTDGFLSSDMYLQDSNTYHNFSYVIIVEKALREFKNVLMNIVHPAGLSMLATYVVKANMTLPDGDQLNVHNDIYIQPVVAGSINTSAYDAQGNIIGSGTSFTTTANVGDLIVYNTADSSRYLQTKQITAVVNDSFIATESNSVFLVYGGGSINISTGANVIVGVGFYGNVGVSDVVELNVNNTIYQSLVESVSNGSINVNTVFTMSVSNTNVLCYPTINNASYQIIQLK